MSRPRTVSDADILDATSRVISRLGPSTLTLADVSEESGLSPAGLVQRFGSKRGLMLALVRQRAAEARGEVAATRRAQPSPLEALMLVLTSIARVANTPQAVANQLCFQQMDLADPEFHQAAFDLARSMLTEIQALLDEAIGAGELVECDTEFLARSVQTAANGALFTWAVYRQGTLDEWVRGEVEAVLEPYFPPLPAES